MTKRMACSTKMRCLEISLFSRRSCFVNLCFFERFFGRLELVCRSVSPRYPVSASSMVSGKTCTRDSLNSLKSCFFPSADDLSIFEIYQHLCFQGMSLFLYGIIPLLFFWGRSIGDSVASTSITSYYVSLFNGALRPGSENVPSWIKVFSTHLIPR